MKKKYYTLPQAATALGVTRHHLYNLYRLGMNVFPVKKCECGQALLIPTAYIEAELVKKAEKKGE